MAVRTRLPGSADLGAWFARGRYGPRGPSTSRTWAVRPRERAQPGVASDGGAVWATTVGHSSSERRSRCAVRRTASERARCQRSGYHLPGQTGPAVRLREWLDRQGGRPACGERVAGLGVETSSALIGACSPSGTEWAISRAMSPRAPWAASTNGTTGGWVAGSGRRGPAFDHRPRAAGPWEPLNARTSRAALTPRGPADELPSGSPSKALEARALRGASSQGEAAAIAEVGAVEASPPFARWLGPAALARTCRLEREEVAHQVLPNLGPSAISSLAPPGPRSNADGGRAW